MGRNDYKRQVDLSSTGMDCGGGQGALPRLKELSPLAFGGAATCGLTAESPPKMKESILAQARAPP